MSEAAWRVGACCRCAVLALSPLPLILSYKSESPCVEQTLVPQTLESPLFFHLSGGGGPGGAAQFEAAVEQVAAVGFDMVRTGG